MNFNGHTAGERDSNAQSAPFSSRLEQLLVAGCCSGDCLAAAQEAFDAASADRQLGGHNLRDIRKRFEFLKDVAGSDRHKEAEILLENALALYEVAYGQEHPTVANILLDLAALHQLHGNADYAAYLTSWAADILRTHRQEPTHEFFHLFGYDEPDDLAEGH